MIFCCPSSSSPVFLHYCCFCCLSPSLSAALYFTFFNSFIINLCSPSPLSNAALQHRLQLFFTIIFISPSSSVVLCSPSPSSSAVFNNVCLQPFTIGPCSPSPSSLAALHHCPSPSSSAAHHHHRHMLPFTNVLRSPTPLSSAALATVFCSPSALSSAALYRHLLPPFFIIVCCPSPSSSAASHHRFFLHPFAIILCRLSPMFACNLSPLSLAALHRHA